MTREKTTGKGRRASASLMMLCLTTAATGVLAQGAPRAVPIEDPPLTPRAVPFQPGGTPPRAAVVPEGAGRRAAPAAPRPAGPDEDLFDYATMVYERKEYSMAAQSFSQYLQRYPGGRHVAMCLFRLGESYVNQNQADKAEQFYLEVVNRYPTSEGAPSAAYRLGAIRYNEALQAGSESERKSRFSDSAKYFAFSESKSQFPQIKLAAGYNKSRAYQGLGDRKNMMLALQAVAKVKTDNPYLESALLSLGTALLSEDKKKEALAMFLDLISASKDPLIVSDSLVKAGVIEAETGKPDDAIKHFEEALKMTETTPENRGVALVGTVQALYAKGDYNAVIDAYIRNSSALPPGDLRPKMLLLVGNAYRMRKTYARAVEMYLLIEQNHSGTSFAFEAGYWKLYCFYLLGDKELPDFARNFLARYAKERGDHEFVMLARLILADAHFNKEQYAEAADAFIDLNPSKLPEKLRPESMFNKGWAEAEAGRHQDAISSFTRFITEFPKHEFVPRALARRGLSSREVRDLPKAQADFAQVIKDYPGDPATELAYLQSGLIHMELREVKEMIADLGALLEKFPKTAAAAQANYLMGRGYFEQKQFDKAVEALRKAVSLDDKTYLDKASPMVVLSYYAKQDADGLAKAVDEYREANPNAVTPPNVLGWLGITLFNKGDYARSARFLTYCTLADSAATSPAIWDHLGRAWLEQKNYSEALAAIDNLLQNPPDLAVKARGLLTKSRALLGLARFAEADQFAQEGLQIVKDGRLQAQLLIQEGDIYFAEAEQMQKAGDPAGASKRFNDAAGKFIVPSQMFVDPEITPEALFKAAMALDRAGQRDKAVDLMKQLKERYPEYVPPQLKDKAGKD